ncbi:hypothetical protein [Paenibacillus tengchongensis]|uniref:hypothetical protein n=1 Tax=Paenibacillus tengchongensis TaxID=2608684 RepID=UPI00124E0631|nr:hypothetical protein [Paenibacillus tengchongensis]
MMEERKPQWYEQARKGPYEQSRFTDAHADQVMQRLTGGGTEPKRRQSRRRGWVAAVAGILLFAGAGAVYFGQETGREPAVPAATASPAVQTVPEATDEEMKAAAERLMQQYIGRTLPFKSMDWPGGYEQARLMYEDGVGGFAFVLVSAETGEVVMASIDASLTPEEADGQLLAKGEEKLRELGYKGEYKPESVRRGINYRASDSEPAQIYDNVTVSGGTASIQFNNGVYSYAHFMVDEGDIRPEALLIGVEAIEKLGNPQNMRFHYAWRYVGDKKNFIGLTYGNDDNVLATVGLDYDTLELFGISDATLQIAKPDDPEKRAEQDQALLAMVDAQLQSTAAAVADGLFGIRLEDYVLVKNQPTPGTVTFVSSDKDVPDIQASYNLNGVFFSFTKMVEHELLVEPVN